MSRSLMFLLFILSSCSGGNKNNSKILPPGKMQSVLWDIIEADAYVWSFKRDDSSVNPPRENARMQAAIFEKHGVSRGDYYASLDYYVDRSDKFIPMLDSIMAHHPAITPGKSRRTRLGRDSLKLIVQ